MQTRATILHLSTILVAFLGTLHAQESSSEPAVDMDVVIISAPKLPQNLLTAPLSATVATEKELQDRGVRTVKDAAFFAPNTNLIEFVARKLSNPRFRGIGGSPMNPGVTTYYDGVPQFNGNSSSLELLDVEQVDIVRGPAGALFGRNTVGGLINITSRRPSLDAWGGQTEFTFGNYNSFDYRASVTGPLVQDQLGFSFAGGYSERDGYTTDTTSGSDIDNRSAWFGKTQFLWTPDEDLEVRFILFAEQDSDGDYALQDLAANRNNPRVSSRDFIGFTNRDVLMPTLQITYHADAFDFTSTTGLVWWETEDLTDLDYGFGLPPGTPPGLTLPPGTSFLRRSNLEKQSTWTQEFRFANPSDSPITLSDEITLAWQAGIFLFHQDYEQNVSQTRQPLLFGGFGAVAGNQLNTQSNLTDWGIGTYLQGTLTFWDRLDLTGGVRWDYEDKEASLQTNSLGITPFPLPPVAAATTANSLSRSFHQVTPQAAIAYDLTPNLISYLSFAGGFKAGGFNAGAPAGAQAFGEETSWNYEIGFKGKAMDDSLTFNLAFFYTDWQNLQLNTPNPLTPALYLITNAGDASAKGIELDFHYQPASAVEFFGSAGWIDTTFHSGATDVNPFLPPLAFTGVPANISGNQIPFVPDYTVSFGSQVTWELGGGLDLYARGEVKFLGSFNYDSLNSAAQDAYTLANFRLGVRKNAWFAEAYVNNAFNTEYYPIAIPLPGVSPSGYVGESGAPVTFGMRVGYRF